MSCYLFNVRSKANMSQLNLPHILHPFNGLFSRTTWVSRYQKGKTSLNLKWGKRWWGLGKQWHHLQTICTLLQTANHTNTSSLNFYRPYAFPDAQATETKHWRHTNHCISWGKNHPFPTISAIVQWTVIQESAILQEKRCVFITHAQERDSNDMTTPTASASMQSVNSSVVTLQSQQQCQLLLLHSIRKRIPGFCHRGVSAALPRGPWYHRTLSAPGTCTYNTHLYTTCYSTAIHSMTTSLPACTQHDHNRCQ